MPSGLWDAIRINARASGLTQGLELVMADRITVSHLRALAARLNRIMGTPEEAYSKREDGTYKANIGNYHISSEYGGYCLHQMMNDGGGVTTPISTGHIPARGLYDQMQAYISGIEAGQRLAKREG